MRELGTITLQDCSQTLFVVTITNWSKCKEVHVWLITYLMYASIRGKQYTKCMCKVWGAYSTCDFNHFNHTDSRMHHSSVTSELLHCWCWFYFPVTSVLNIPIQPSPLLVLATCTLYHFPSSCVTIIRFTGIWGWKAARSSSLI